MTSPRMLVFELRMMGDAIMSLPFVRSASGPYDVWVACSPAGAQVYRRVMAEEKLVVWDCPWNRETGKYAWGRPARREAAAFIRAVRSVRPDVAVAGWADARVHLLMALSGARLRAGYPMNSRNYYAPERPWRRRQLKAGRVLQGLGALLLARPLLNRPADRRDYEQHHVEDWRQLADGLGIPWRADPPWLAPAGGADPLGAGAFRDRMAADGRRLVVIHAGARTPNRQWPADRFRAVMEAVARGRRLAFVLVSSPEAPLRAPASPDVLTVAPADFEQLCGVVGTADVVLCNDSGVAHLGAALGKKVVTVFSSQNPHWCAPYGNEDLVVDQPVCPYRSCFNRCVMPSYICLEAVTPDRVADKLTSVLDRGVPSRGDS